MLTFSEIGSVQVLDWTGGSTQLTLFSCDECGAVVTEYSRNLHKHPKP